MEEDTYREVEQFLYREARLLDERKFEDWLTLFTDDVKYWAPVMFNREMTGRDAANENELAFFDDDKETLRLRVKRLYTEFVVAEDPPSRTSRTISNIEVEDGPSGYLTVRSNFLIYKNRFGGETSLFAGHRLDTLKRVGRELKIAHRKIILDQDVLTDRHITLFF